jgi:hypothetical protein
VNVAREFHLLGGEIAVAVFGKLLAENENGIERGAQANAADEILMTFFSKLSCCIMQLAQYSFYI